MKKLMTLAAFTAALTVTGAPQTMVRAEQPAAELSLTYSALRANVPVGGCGCFWMSGGSAEIAVPVWRSLSAVAELSGEHIADLPGYPNTGLSLLSGLGGARVSAPTYARLTPFGQGLIGGVHAFDSSFPGAARSSTSATSFALAAGIGLDLSITRHVLLRPIQADYQYMRLPNESTNQQHDIRLSGGVVYRFSR